MRKTKEEWNEYNEIWEALSQSWASKDKCLRCQSSLFFYQERPDYKKNTYREEKACYLCHFVIESRLTNRPYDPNHQLIYHLPLAEIKDTMNR